MSLAAGSRLGPYEILAPLGAGGMGEVYRARDERLGREVAIKVLPAELAGDAERLERFEREARAAAALNHPNILAVHDLGTHEGAPFLVCELLEGETLRDRLRAGRPAPAATLGWALQLARGIAAAHARGVVHRDLKPENLFLTRDGHLKILDFGLAKVSATATAATAPTVPGTLAGTVLGTAGYMAPEQARGLPADARSDIFAFGAVVYELLAGESAFQRETAADTLAAVLREEPRELTATPLGLPPEVVRLVRRCLAKRPEDRYQSAADLAFDLEALAAAPRAAAPDAAATASIAVLPFSDLSPGRCWRAACARPATACASPSSSSRSTAATTSGPSATTAGSRTSSRSRTRSRRRWRSPCAACSARRCAAGSAKPRRATSRPTTTTCAGASSSTRRGARGWSSRARCSSARWRSTPATPWPGPGSPTARPGSPPGGATTPRRSAAAKEASRRAVELAPDLAETHASRGQSLVLARRFAEAEEEFQTALRLHPGLFEALYFYARACFAQGRLAESADLFARAEAANPEDYQSPLLATSVLDALGRPDEAEAATRRGVAAAQRYLELHPDDSRACYLAGGALVRLGSREEGLALAERALSIDPDEPAVLYNLACVYALAGLPERALDCLEQAVGPGFGLLDWIVHDHDLATLRGTPRFEAVLARLG